MRVEIAVKALLVKSQRFLLLRKSNTETVSPNELDLPGGRARETPETALVREVFEETGLHIKIIKPIEVWRYDIPSQDITLFGITYLCRRSGGRLKLSSEHVHAEWMELKPHKSFPKWLNQTIKLVIRKPKAH